MTAQKRYIDYYPFGLQTSSSWTRENSNNDFLYNEGSELNKTTGWYETPFRNYDAALGRLTSVDPMATKYASYSAYHYAGNNPVIFNDPTGADFTVTVPHPTKPGYWSVITQKVDMPPSYSSSNNYWSGQDWVMKTAHMTQDEIWEYQKGQAEAFAMAMAQSDPMMAQSYYTALQSQGPKVYSKWCNCEVNAFDVVAHDPTYQNKEYRRQAQNAIYAYMTKSEQQVKDFYFKNFGWSQGLADIKIGAPPNFFVDERGLISDGHKSVLARTMPGKNNTSTIYVSPLLASATEKWLFGILGHETVHVYDNFKHGYDTSGASEYNAWSWSLQWARAIGDADMEMDAVNKLGTLSGSQNPIFNYRDYGLPISPKTP